MQISARFRAILQALLVTFLWSTSWVLIKFSIHEIPPLTFAGLRYTIAVMILLPGLRKHHEALRTMPRKKWGQLALLGLTFYTLTQGAQFLTLEHLNATTFSLLLNATTIFVAFFGMFVLKEKLSFLQWAGIAAFLVGVLVYFFPSIKLLGEPIGFLFAAVTVLANAAASLLGRFVNREKTIPPLVVTVISMGIGAVVLLSLGLIIEGIPALTLVNLGVILWLAVVNTAFAFTLWNRSLQVLSAFESSIINNTMLIQIAILALVFLGEKFTVGDVIGLLIAAVGIFLANMKPKPKKTFNSEKQN